MDELAALESLDNGKPIQKAYINIFISMELLRYYAGWTDKLGG